MKKFFTSFIISISIAAYAQPASYQTGLSNPTVKRHALVNATVITHPEARPRRMTILIDDGRIVRIRPDTTVPPGYIRWDMSDKWLYPAFVDLFVPQSPPVRPKSHRSGPQYGPSRQGVYSWNDALHPHHRYVIDLPPSPSSVRQHRKGGFAVILPHRADGIIRGTGPLMAALDGPRLHEAVLEEDGAWFLSFRKGTSRQSYPSSLMGAIALLRQTFYDVQWYRQGGHREGKDLGLDALRNLMQKTAIFAASEKYDLPRIHRLGREFSLDFIIQTDLTAYQLRSWLRNTHPRLIIRPELPGAPDVEDPLGAELVTWAQLKHWELAPWGLYLIHRTGTPFVLTMQGMKPDSFLRSVREAVRHGLPPAEALRALTTRPAQWLGVDDRIGTLEEGKQAHILVASGDLWQDTTDILGLWVQGKPFISTDEGWHDTRGTYVLRINQQIDTLHIGGKRLAPRWKVKVHGDSAFRPISHHWEKGQVHFEYRRHASPWRFSGFFLRGKWEGKAFDGKQWHRWEMKRLHGPRPAKPDTAAIDTPDFYIPHPFTALAPPTPPRPERVLLKNATVWTGTAILPHHDVLMADGKIAKVGKNLPARGARVVDASGRHLTAGIIDEHSHIAISRGVNEGSHPVTAEVRIGDVINPADINIYRQLAGGVTTSHLLHGSANPIGGQTELVKLRWGQDAEGLKFKGHAPFIKFALGENVKQSNWGDRYTVRYPQTRMGVEQIIEDAMRRAQAYDSLRAHPPKEHPLRRNLRLEALAEILRGKRHITCHSYVQSEILMLMRLAERLGFRINTFTHVLEGYKVAPELKAHGAGASTFSDWWAYKYEVIEAIPYNAAILTRMGVVTAINSDDAEMGRRLNQEAAKSIKYGGLTPVEAWKLVTLNPARLLHIDHRVGRIEKGYDADIVLWDAPPLSSRARVVQTYVDGRLYYDRTQAQRRAEWARKDRERLIRKVLNTTKKKNRVPVKPAERPPYRCRTTGDFLKMQQP